MTNPDQDWRSDGVREERDAELMSDRGVRGLLMSGLPSRPFVQGRSVCGAGHPTGLGAPDVGCESGQRSAGLMIRLPFLDTLCLL
jgi:hypothetical protein